jgi:hypothetical protein
VKWNNSNSVLLNFADSDLLLAKGDFDNLRQMGQKTFNQSQRGLSEYLHK